MVQLIKKMRTSGKIAVKPFKEFLVFTLSNQYFAFDILKIKEIRTLQNTHITQLVNAPAYIAGMAKVKNRIFPVMDLRKRFQLNAVTDNYTVVIVLSNSEMQVGFIVDSVLEIVAIELEQIQASTSINAVIHEDYISGLAPLSADPKSSIVFIVNDEKLFVNDDDVPA